MKIFSVEDDPYYADLLQYVIEQNPDNKVTTFSKGQEILDSLYLKPSVITVDYSLPDMSGHDLLKKIKAEYPDIFVIMVSSQEDIGIAVELLKDGAYDYIVKNDDTRDRLWNAFRNLSNQIELKEEVIELREKFTEQYDFSKNIIGESDTLKQSLKLIAKAAKTEINVTITGETGTGKEVVANTIHHNSGRKNKKFIAVNAAAIPKDLIESELFGHEKGAFTGASQQRIGKFEEANGGTIFLDEIGDLDLNVQAKLLRVLQEQEVIRVGGNKPIKLNARIITATHKNLAEEVKNGNFRQDLYYRLIGLPLDLPPLRERGNDIIILANFFLKKFSETNKTPTTLSKEAKKKLLQYHYPGNVRELKAIIELSSVMSEGKEIEAEDITFNALNSTEDLLIEEDTLKGYTRKIIQHFLNKNNHNVIQVAEKLDVGKSTIYQLIKNGELKTK
jgi:two-component system response regulator AtoC